MKTLKDFIEKASENASQIFNRTGQILPMVHAVTRNGDHVIMQMPPGDKDTSIATVRAWFVLNDVVRYVFIDEAWILETADESTIKALQTAKRSVSQHPQRKEILLLSGEDEKEGHLQIRRYIIRGKGKPQLGPVEISQLPYMAGRLAGLLPQRGTMQ
jgi:hypothetical protein